MNATPLFAVSEFAARAGFEGANWPLVSPQWSEKFELMARLQTTLDIRRLLEIFSDHLEGTIHHHGISFASVKGPAGELDQRYCFGSCQGVGWRVLLKVDNRELGWLEIHFEDAPINELQDAAYPLIRCLIYPLNNALRFDRIQSQALLDEVTGLGSRAAFTRSIQHEISRVERSSGQTSLSLLVMDLDEFKKLNDELGHLAGDRALGKAAQTARAGLRDGDRLFRYGGDEFVALLPDADGQAAERIAMRLEKLVQSECVDPRLSITVGAATWTVGSSAESLFEVADKALYARKALKRGTLQARVSTR